MHFAFFVDSGGSVANNGPAIAAGVSVSVLIAIAIVVIVLLYIFR